MLQFLMIPVSLIEMSNMSRSRSYHRACCEVAHPVRLLVLDIDEPFLLEPVTRTRQAPVATR